MDLDNLEAQIKSFIVTRLSLDISPDDIADDQVLFGESKGSLGLDSVDALELVVGIRSDFGIVVDEDVDPSALMTVRAIGDFIRTNLGQLQTAGEVNNAA